jgi:hypothetical protein
MTFRPGIGGVSSRLAEPHRASALLRSFSFRLDSEYIDYAVDKITSVCAALQVDFYPIIGLCRCFHVAATI